MRIRQWFGAGAAAGTVQQGSSASTSIGVDDSPFDIVTGNVLVSAAGTRQPRLLFPTSTAIMRVGWFITPQTGIAVSFAFNFGGMPPSQATVLLQALTGGHAVQSARVEINPAGRVVLRNAANAIAGTSAAALAPLTDYRCEIVIDVAGNAAVNVYLLDTAIVAASTAGAVGATHDALRFGVAGVSASPVPAWSIDELRVYDGVSTNEDDRPLTARVLSRSLVADVEPRRFTASTLTRTLEED